MSASVQHLFQEAVASLPLPAEWSWRIDVRPRRRTLGIEVDEHGGVLFAVPADADPGEFADAVRSRLPRLAREVQRRRNRSGEPVKELVAGTGFAYLGRRYRLRFVSPDAAWRVRLSQGRLEVPRHARLEERGRQIVDWYVACGSRWLAARAEPLAVRAGVTPTAVSVLDLGRRWGSCGPGGEIAVHWAVMQLPPALVEFVLIHELTHLRIPVHGATFRRQLRFALPDADERERRFTAEEPLLWRGAVS